MKLGTIPERVSVDIVDIIWYNLNGFNNLKGEFLMERGRSNIDDLISRERDKLSTERKKKAEEKRSGQQRQEKERQERERELIARFVTQDFVSKVTKSLEYCLEDRTAGQDNVSTTFDSPFSYAWGVSEADQKLVLRALEKRLGEEVKNAKRFVTKIEVEHRPVEGYEIGDNRAGAFIQTGGGDYYYLRVTMYI